MPPAISLRRAEILSLLQQLNRRPNKTIRMVTHDPKAAGHAGRRLEMDQMEMDQLEMDKGRLVERAMADT